MERRQQRMGSYKRCYDGEQNNRRSVSESEDLNMLTLGYDEDDLDFDDVIDVPSTQEQLDEILGSDEDKFFDVIDTQSETENITSSPEKERPIEISDDSAKNEDSIKAVTLPCPPKRLTPSTINREKFYISNCGNYKLGYNDFSFGPIRSTIAIPATPYRTPFRYFHTERPQHWYHHSNPFQRKYITKSRNGYFLSERRVYYLTPEDRPNNPTVSVTNTYYAYQHGRFSYEELRALDRERFRRTRSLRYRAHKNFKHYQKAKEERSLRRHKSEEKVIKAIEASAEFDPKYVWVNPNVDTN